VCGIAGLFDQNGEPADAGALAGMIHTLNYRGPDGHGVQTDGAAGLAHARLSIIDVAGGTQPMSDVDANLSITFNGEIFNYLELRQELILRGYRFATRSDTEVILQMYADKGVDCVRHFNGQWAFAIWDRRKRQLFLSRDRMGVRPLFYTQVNGKFLFASEVKALFNYPGVSRELDLEGLDQIFSFWVTVPPKTVFRNIYQLPPGHSMLVTQDAIRVFPHWSLEYAPADDRSDAFAERKSEELLDLLRDAVRIRLRSDVPVGAYLSGGIDSTIITSLAKQVIDDRLRTFSVSFEDAEFDESAYQRRASEFLCTDHASVHCGYDTIGDVFPDVVWHAEQPILRTAPAPLYVLSKLVRESGFKVVLTGEGADEVLGGYDIFKEAKIRRFWGVNLDSRWRPMLLRRLYPYMQNVQNQSDVYLKNFFAVSPEALGDPFFSHLPRWELTGKLKMFFSEDVKSQLKTSDVYRELRSTLPRDYGAWPSFCQAEYLEASGLLPGYILSSQGDRMAMAHSVEGRYPFLDYRVVEFGAKLPPWLKMKVLSQKHLLRRAAHGLVPQEVIARPKQPYRAPDGKSLFGGRQRDYVERLLAPERIGRDGVFDPQAVGMLVKKFRAGRAISTKDNMALVGILSTQLVLEKFLREFKPTEVCANAEKH